MKCQQIDDRLDDFVDGALEAGPAAAVAAHLASCPRCREQEAQLRTLLAHAAALPRSVSPSRDLWPGIAGRLERRRPWAWGWNPVALAAAATVVAGLVAVLWSVQAPAPVRTVQIPATSPGPDLLAVDTGAADAVLAAAERDYESAANALLEALQRGRSRLAPETLASVETNLEVIDRALGEVRGALAKDPENPELGRMLVATHRKKVDVLRRVVRLSTEL